MKVEAVIFDFGGVLMRTEDRNPRTELATRLGMNYTEISALIFESPSALQATKGIITAEQHWAELQKSLDLPDLEFEQVRTEFWAGDVLDLNLVNLLRDLRSKYTTILLSNAWDDLRHMIDDVWQIGDAFDHLVISAEIGLAKPDLAIYQWVINELGVKPAKAVFVDDFLHNIEAAWVVGMHGIHFRSPDQALGELRSLIELP
jgi:epoxide hydrolase-like predicted phosphatase